MTFGSEPHHEIEKIQSHIKNVELKLEFPDFGPDAIEKTYSSPEMKLRAQQTREVFNMSAEVVAITGHFGLGDSIMELRYILRLAQKTDKHITCQVHPALLPLAEKLSNAFANITFCAKVPLEKATDPTVFFINLAPDNSVSDSLKWIDQPMKYISNFVFKSQLRDTIGSMRSSGNQLDYEQLFPYTGNAPVDDDRNEIESRLGISQSGIARSDAVHATLLEMIGIHIEPQEILENSILPWDPEVLQKVPQTFDFMIAPDAQERESGNAWSDKSFPPDLWNTLFERQELKGKKVAIVRGVSHPRYCDAIVVLAKRHGLDVTFLQGDLSTIAEQMLATKCFIGMDSGTTHLAVDVQRFAKKYGREIQVKEIIDEYRDIQVEMYGIVGTPIQALSYEGDVVDSSKNFSKVTDSEAVEIANYFFR